MPQPSAEKEKKKSWWDKFVDGAGSFFRQVIGGDFSGEVTIQGTVGEVAVGFIPGVGTAADIRDLAYDVSHWEWSGTHFIRVGIDIIAFIPLGDIAKGVGNTVDGIGDVAKHMDDAADAAGDIAKHADDIADAAEDVAKHADDIADGVGDAAKKGGRESIKSSDLISEKKLTNQTGRVDNYISLNKGEQMAIKYYGRRE